MSNRPTMPTEAVQSGLRQRAAFRPRNIAAREVLASTPAEQEWIYAGDDEVRVLGEVAIFQRP